MREGWKKVTLGDVSTMIKRGVSPKYVDNEGFVVLNQKCIRDFKVSFIDSRLTSKEKKSSEEKFLQVGDVLINSTGTGTLGRTGFVKELFEKTTVDTHVTIVRGDEKEVNSRFLGFLLNYYEPLIENLGKGATNQIELSAKDLATLKINLPPLETQQKIANILSGYDDLIENNQKRIKLLEEMAQQTYEEWFVRMRFPGYETAVLSDDGLPEGWKKLKLGDVSNFKYGSMPKKENLIKTGFPVFSGYRITGYTSKYNVDKKSLIVVARGVGGTGDIKFTPKKCWLTNLSIRIDLKDDIAINYLYYYLRSANLRSLDSGAAQSQITIVSLEAFPISLAERDLIKRFNNLVEPIFASIDILKDQNLLLSESRNILLPRLMMGMIDVESLEAKPTNTTIIPLEQPKKEPSKEFKEAVLIACLTGRFGSEKFPLGRKRYTKLSYLFHRYSDNKIQDYLRKAAGPYNPKTKYGGPEKIAITSKYIKEWKSEKGTTGFVVAEKIEDAKKYFSNYWQIVDLNWLASEFKFKSNDELELLATVDNSLVELSKKNMEFTSANVLKIIKSEKEWEAKLERTIFSDANVERSIGFLTKTLQYEK